MLPKICMHQSASSVLGRIPPHALINGSSHCLRALAALDLPRSVGPVHLDLGSPAVCAHSTSNLLATGHCLPGAASPAPQAHHMVLMSLWRFRAQEFVPRWPQFFCEGAPLRKGINRLDLRDPGIVQQARKRPFPTRCPPRNWPFPLGRVARVRLHELDIGLLRLVIAAPPNGLLAITCGPS